ncbi:MAG: hypothetical protein R6V72_19090 [Cyclobacterium sp.]|uniref:hypothetical protein n=1 Tax=Cyclobacterium sp. TaxID=1966343 RepID=UPI003970BB15
MMRQPMFEAKDGGKNSMKLKNIQPILFTVLLLAPWLLFAANDEFARQEQMELRKTMGQPNATLLNINKIAHWIRSNGISAHDPNTNASGVYFPRGVGAGVIFTQLMVCPIGSIFQAPMPLSAKILCQSVPPSL